MLKQVTHIGTTGFKENTVYKVGRLISVQSILNISLCFRCIKVASNKINDGNQVISFHSLPCERKLSNNTITVLTHGLV
jgi:hypothetical protein